jgi:hypothetical protein
MQQYIGTKLINAKPMNRLEYNVFRGWELPSNENGSDEGYLVEYLDGGKPNTDSHEGYVSWSPKEQFDNAYKESGSLSFGDAIVYLKEGKKVARSGWNGKGMFLILQGKTPDIKPYHGSCYANALHGIQDTVAIDAHIDMYTAGRTMQPGWLASQADILANDWAVL